MDKKGFTLVELLGVIVIISVIIGLVFPSVTNTIRKTKETIRDIQINRILDATYDFTLKNISSIPNEGTVKYITLNQLKKENLIDNDIKNSISNEEYPNDLVISIKNKTRKTDKYSKINGNYLYAVEFDFMNSDEYDENRPQIVFDEYEVSPIVINLNIGDKYLPLKYSATSTNGVDLSNEVIEHITFNSKTANVVDTSKVGIYHIYYSVVDDKGYSNVETVSVIISDSEKPVLTIPDNQTISKSLTTYDLMDGVSCIDNSGVCDIRINGDIQYGISGKYIIEYVASDSSGNTTILKRVITIQ